MLKNNAKPFLKWAGGKTQLIESIELKLPKNIINKEFTFIEPFVGGGAVLFWMIRTFPTLKNVVINDINKDLIDCYKTIKYDVNDLIKTLEEWEKEYNHLSITKEEKKQNYYAKRNLYNERKSSQLVQSALFIFLNRTCFNGLYRVNKKNKFNVPQGSYVKPQICNRENLLAVSEALQRVEILNGDYSKTIHKASENTFFYFDPPYKPLNETSSFNSYSKDEFNDAEQIRLKKFCEELDRKGHKWILSNSDLKGKNPENVFFDDLYAEFNINRVLAKRSINSNPSKRGLLTELLITN
jgi:DNA adenine methylase